MDDKLQMAQKVVELWCGAAKELRMSVLVVNIANMRRKYMEEQGITNFLTTFTHQDDVVHVLTMTVQDLFSKFHIELEPGELAVAVQMLLLGIRADQEVRHPGQEWNPLTGENRDNSGYIYPIPGEPDPVYFVRAALCAGYYGRKYMSTIMKTGLKRYKNGPKKTRVVRKPELDTMIRTSEIR